MAFVGNPLASVEATKALFEEAKMRGAEVMGPGGELPAAASMLCGAFGMAVVDMTSPGDMQQLRAGIQMAQMQLSQSIELMAELRWSGRLPHG